jgi:hypothetical protein
MIVVLIHVKQSTIKTLLIHKTTQMNLTDMPHKRHTEKSVGRRNAWLKNLRTGCFWWRTANQKGVRGKFCDVRTCHVSICIVPKFIKLLSSDS